MPRRIVPLLLAVVLGATGCTSVAPSMRPPTPSLAPAGHPSPAPVEWPPVQPPARAELAPAELDTKPTKEKSAKPDAPNRSADDGPSSPPRRRYVPPDPPRRAPAPDRKPEHSRPQPSPSPPRPSYGMRSVCAASDGVAAPYVTALCRDAFGH